MFTVISIVVVLLSYSCDCFGCLLSPQFNYYVVGFLVTVPSVHALVVIVLEEIHLLWVTISFYFLVPFCVVIKESFE